MQEAGGADPGPGGGAPAPVDPPPADPASR